MMSARPTDFCDFIRTYHGHLLWRVFGVLHEAADSIIDKHKLKGAKLEHFVNGVYMLEYAFRRGLGKRDDIDKQFAHMASSDSVSKTNDN